MTGLKRASRAEIIQMIERVEGHTCQSMLRTRASLDENVTDETVLNAIDADIAWMRDILDEAERMCTDVRMKLTFGSNWND